ncbi:MAG: GHKL domain-containing protein [Clostridiales bacterium]|nr:GHKL domain-containing protein [Clostridiales bacterium]
MFWILLAIYITELVKYGIWFYGICSLRVKRPWVTAVTVIGFALLVRSGCIDENTLLALWSFTSIIVYIFVVDCAKNEKALNIFKAAFMIICIGEIVGGIISPFSVEQSISFKNEKIIYLINNIIVVTILCFVNVIKRKVKLPNNEKWKRIYKFVIYISASIMGIAIFLTIAGFQTISRYNPNEKVILFSKIISIISFISIACLAMIMLYIENENKTIKKYLETDALLLKTQRNLYNAMLAKNEETRRFRHDMQNHLICLGELAYLGDVSKVQEYVSGIEGQFRAIQNKTYSVGNDIIDAVLNYHLSFLDKDVKVNINGMCSNDIKINAVELCTIVSNLVQNAVEALNRFESVSRYLTINISGNHSCMQFEIRNSVSEQEEDRKIVNGLIVTSKADKENHGIGIRNVKETVEKNGGIFKINIDQGEFMAKVAIPLL